MEPMTETLKKVAAQEQFCHEHKIPFFAPSDGICWSCRRQIFDRISLEKAGSEHITGCPICNHSYCE